MKFRLFFLLKTRCSCCLFALLSSVQVCPPTLIGMLIGIQSFVWLRVVMGDDLQRMQLSLSFIHG